MNLIANKYHTLYTIIIYKYLINHVCFVRSNQSLNHAFMLYKNYFTLVRKPIPSKPFKILCVGRFIFSPYNSHLNVVKPTTTAAFSGQLRAKKCFFTSILYIVTSVGRGGCT